MIGDADDGYDFTAIYPFVEKLREGYDVVVGCRFARWNGRIFCGLRACRRDAFRRMELRMTRMDFASEMIIKATLRGLRVGELPITLHPAGRSRPPHLRTWRDGRHPWFMLLLFKLLVFALFSKAFAIAEEFLPPDPRVERDLRVVTLEVGVLLGLGVTLVGLGLLLGGVLYWQAHGYGSLSYLDSLRLIIPAVTALTLGFEIVFSRFFVSALGLSW